MSHSVVKIKQVTACKILDTYSFGYSSTFYMTGTELDPGNTAVSVTDKISASMKVPVEWGSELLNKSLLKYNAVKEQCYEGIIYRQNAEQCNRKVNFDGGMARDCP